MKKLFKSGFMVIGAILLVSSANATLTDDKATIRSNMVVSYDRLPPSVDTVSELFLEGMVYGRLRTNTFYWDWDKEIPNEQIDNRSMGVGGSLIYKSARLNGISGTLGLYTSQNPVFTMDKKDVGLVKSGNDMFCRNNVKNGGTYDGSYGISAVGQAYIQYDVAETSLIAGRQLVETTFTKSNDTKMIPNTFDGVTATIKDIDNTTIKFAYLVSQKLRDHATSHDVLAFDSWNQNDDSAVNKSLTVTSDGNSTAIGDNNRLIVTSITNNSIKNLKTNIGCAVVPNVVSNVNLEAHYSINAGSYWKIAPGFRYMKQFDNLDSSGNVASLDGAAKAHGYTDPTSLNGSLMAYRVDFKTKAFLGRLGYSHIADKADIIAPWRGFPTGGFTRIMSQYNWHANTKTYMVRLGYDFGEADVIPGFSITGRYAIQDFDDGKDNVQADTNVVHIDASQNISKNLKLKVRLAFVEADDSILKSDSTYKTDVSYNEYRLEVNYLF